MLEVYASKSDVMSMACALTPNTCQATLYNRLRVSLRAPEDPKATRISSERISLTMLESKLQRQRQLTLAAVESLPPVRPLCRAWQ